MAVEVTMPQLSDTMEQGTIVNWMVEEGDTVQRGDIIAEIETDKATMDLEAFDDGVLLKKLYAEGEAAPTQSLIAVIGEEGEDISDLLEQAEEPKTESESVDDSDETEEIPQEEPSGEEETESPSEGSEDEEAEREVEAQEMADSEPEISQEPTETSPTETDGERLRISPVARRLATKYNVDVHSISGSGPQGRIIKRDVMKVLEDGSRDLGESDVVSGAPSTRSSKLRSERKELSGMRSTIARRMTEAFRDVPHFYLEKELEVGQLLEMRDQLSSDHDVDYSMNDLLLYVVSRALGQHPDMNATFEEDHVQLYDHVDLAFAVAVEDGLYTPVIKSADQLSLSEIHHRSREYAEKARNGNLVPEDYQGGTFTVSNLGMFDVDNFKAVINPPQAGILAVGKVQEKPVARDGRIEVGQRMNLTLSCDHRSVDGAIGAQFLQTFSTMVENPFRLFI